MAKKNPYEGHDIKVLKKELSSNISYLENIDVFNLQDEIDWKPTATGGMAMVVVTTIEYRIQTALIITKMCGNIVLAILEKEGYTQYIEGALFIVVNTLKNVQAFYEDQPICNITNRRITKQIGYDKKGNPKERTFLVATADSIIRARAIITEKILELLPVIKQLENASKLITIKGGKELPESMQYL